jgi:hypothetical protein
MSLSIQFSITSVDGASELQLGYGICADDSADCHGSMAGAFFGWLKSFREAGAVER